MLCAKFGWNGSGGSGGEDENVNSLRQWRRPWQQPQQWWTTDKVWSEKLIMSLWPGELKNQTKSEDA